MGEGSQDQLLAESETDVTPIVRAGARGGAVTDCMICAPQEHASHTYPLSRPLWLVS
jgi:hypothetical protein